MNMNFYITLLKAAPPLWLLAGGGILTLFVDALFPRRGHVAIYLLGLLVVGTSLVLSFSQWVDGRFYSFDFILCDALSLFFMILVLTAGFLTLLNSTSFFSGGPETPRSPATGSVVTLILFSLVGQIFLFATDHLILIFIGLETMSLAIYVLVGFSRRDPKSNEAAMKYFVMGSVASAVFLYGVALLYGASGTFLLHQVIEKTFEPGLIALPQIAIGLIMAGALFKLALVPFHFWVPDVYEGAPVPITGFMATAVKASALAFFLRVLDALTFISPENVTEILRLIVIATLVVGNLAALVQDNVKRMLAYSSISHAGYLLLGLLVGIRDGSIDAGASSAVIFYLIGYTVMTLGAFAVLSVMTRDGKEASQFRDLAGLARKRPVLAAAFALFMISLLGIPGTVGFVGKYGIFSFAVKNGFLGLAVLGMVTTVISAAYYLRPIVMMYFREPSPDLPDTPVSLPLMFSLVFTATAVIYLGILPTDYLKMASLASLAIK